MTRHALIGAIMLVAVAAVRATAQSVRLRVTDDIDEAPIPSALVTLLSDRALWRTDQDGLLTVRVKHAGPNVFTIRRIGYEPVTTTLNVPEHGVLPVHVVMHAAPRQLDSVRVNARAPEERLSGFDRRRMNSVGGQFITLADIEKRAPFETLDLFMNRTGLRVVRPMDGDPYIVSTRGPTLGACRPRIGLDGVVFGTDFDPDDISPREIYGIEIYSGAATIPAEFLSTADGSACGLIMIWTFGGAQASERRPD